MRNSRPAILLTGQPGVGKTTAIQKIVDQLGDRAGGFYTREVRVNGRRVGFEIVTLDGQTAWLATKAARPAFVREQIYKGYRVSLDAIDGLAVPALAQAANAGKIVVVDEIGPMEMLSKLFCETIIALLDNPSVGIVGSIVQRPDAFADRVKAHPRVILKPVTWENRDRIPTEIYASLISQSPKANSRLP